MKVKIARIKKKIKQQELAEMVGISRYFLYKIENEEAVPNVKIALKIASLLDTTVEELFFS